MTLQALTTHLLFCAALGLLSAAVVRLMIAVGPIDRPNARKAHTQAIPKSGGVGVVAAFMAGIVLLYAFAEFSRLADEYFRGVILASGAIAAVAFIDDLRDWPFVVKLGAQLGAAALAVGSGLVVDAVNLPLAGPVTLGWLAAPLTLAWVLFATNAMNFIDGLNGLAAGVSALAAAMLAGIAAAYGGWFVYFAGLLLTAGLLGFLPFNFPRARIFMGDVGSQFCGFVLAVLAVAAGRFQGVELSVLLVPMLLFGVLYDVAFTLARRLLAGERVTQAHRSHLYQVVNRAGLAATPITLVHWAFVLWGGACCWLFLGATGIAKAATPLLVVPPQLAWTGYVAWRARRAGWSAGDLSGYPGRVEAGSSKSPRRVRQGLAPTQRHRGRVSSRPAGEIPGWAYQGSRQNKPLSHQPGGDGHTDLYHFARWQHRGNPGWADDWLRAQYFTQKGGRLTTCGAGR